MQPSVVETLEKRFLPADHLATAMLRRFAGQDRRLIQETDFGKQTADVRYRISMLLERFGESSEHAETLKMLERQYRARLNTLVDYGYISAERPTITGVDAKEYWVPSWDSIQAALTPECLAKIRTFKEKPILLLVPAKMSLNDQIKRANGKYDFQFMNILRGMGKADIDVNYDLDALVGTGESRGQLLQRDFGFEGWRVVVMEGMEKVEQSTLNQHPDEFIRRFAEEGFDFAEPNDYLMFRLEGFREGISYDKIAGTWLKARPSNSENYLAGGSYGDKDAEDQVMAFYSARGKRPLIGGRRALEIVPQMPATSMEYNVRDGVRIALMLEELTPKNDAEMSIVEEGIRDGNDAQTLLEKVRSSRRPSAFDITAEPLEEAAEIATAAPPEPEAPVFAVVAPSSPKPAPEAVAPSAPRVSVPPAPAPAVYRPTSRPSASAPVIAEPRTSAAGMPLELASGGPPRPRKAASPVGLDQSETSPKDRFGQLLQEAIRASGYAKEERLAGGVIDRLRAFFMRQRGLDRATVQTWLTENANAIATLAKAAKLPPAALEERILDLLPKGGWFSRLRRR